MRRSRWWRRAFAVRQHSAELALRLLLGLSARYGFVSAASFPLPRLNGLNAAPPLYAIGRRLVRQDLALDLSAKRRLCNTVGGRVIEGTSRCCEVLDLVETLLEIQDLLGMKHDVGRLALEAAGRLMQHDARVRECEPHVLLAGSQQQRCHGGGLADA